MKRGGVLIPFPSKLFFSNPSSNPTILAVLLKFKSIPIFYCFCFINPSPSAQNPISQPLNKANPGFHFTPSRPSLNFCRQTRGKVSKHTFLDENYALNTRKLFTRPDFEFLTVKLQLKKKKTKIQGMETRQNLFSFVEVSFESKSF